MFLKKSRPVLAVAACCLLLSVVTPTTNAEELVGLAELVDGSQALATFDSLAPGAPSILPISGLPANQGLVSIDFRPLTGQLFGLGSDNAIYTLNRGTGAASMVGSGFTDQLNGGAFGFDFNPQIDKIRIVSDANQNYVANPDTGDANIATTTDAAFAVGDVNEGIDPNVVHHAYDNNIFGQQTPNPPGTQLRAIDTALDILVTQANNAGTLGTIGSLGIDANDVGGFDIATSGNAYAAFSNGVGAVDSTLYSIDLNTGAATSLGTIPHTIWGLAATPVPEPATGLPVLACLLLLGRRFRSARR
jgi:hypothetical protein